jgi:hypothetical protein
VASQLWIQSCGVFRREVLPSVELNCSALEQLLLDLLDLLWRYTPGHFFLYIRWKSGFDPLDLPCRYVKMM